MMHGIEDAKLHYARRIQDPQHVGNAAVCFSDSFDAGPDLAALGNEIVVGSTTKSAVMLLSYVEVFMAVTPAVVGLVATW
jgi:hypothetical protein